MTTKAFDKWDTDDVERVFHLRRVLDFPTLESWLNAPLAHLDSASQTFVERLRIKLFLYVNGWNEDELKFHFITPLLNFIDFTIEEKNIHAFTQRSLTAVVNDIKLTGRVDFIIATGKTKPIQPFFFLHEYKKERGADNDPRAQLLAEMIAARALNNLEYPLYGCYVVGRMWFFVVLENEAYAESRAFDATQDDIIRIVGILQRAKTIIGALAERYA